MNKSGRVKKARPDLFLAFENAPCGLIGDNIQVTRKSSVQYPHSFAVADTKPAKNRYKIKYRLTIDFFVYMIFKIN